MSRQRQFFRFTQRNQVRGVIYVNGRRTLHRLCSWAEAGIVGVTEDGSPIFKTSRDERRGRRHIIALRDAKRAELQRQEDRRAPRREDVRIRLALQDWMDAASVDHRPGTIARYADAANDYVAACGNHPIADTTLRHIDRLKLHLQGRKLAAATINMRLRALRTFFRWAEERDLLERRPKIALVPQVSNPPNVPTSKDVERLLAYTGSKVSTARAKRYKRLRIFANQDVAAWLWVWTGIRRSAVCFLPRARVRLEERIIELRPNAFYVPKARRPQDVLIPEPLATRLALHFEEFPGEKERWVLDDGAGKPAYPDPHAVTLFMRRIQTAVGINGMGIKSVHGLRAYQAHQLRLAGADLEAIRQRLGHSDIRVTAGYFPEPAAMERTLVRKLERQIGTKVVRSLLEPPQDTDPKKQ